VCHRFESLNPFRRLMELRGGSLVERLSREYQNPPVIVMTLIYSCLPQLVSQCRP